MESSLAIIAAAAAALAAGSAAAEPVNINVLLTPQEQVKFEFGDGSKHFVAAMRREGKAEGTGAFAGAAVTEIGWHDVHPPVSAAPLGYLQVKAPNGDLAILQWRVKAAFMKGEGKPALFNTGYWELVRGTGQFKDKRGVGSLVITPKGGPSLFTLEGEVGDKS